MPHGMGTREPMQLPHCLLCLVYYLLWHPVFCTITLWIGVLEEFELVQRHVSGIVCHSLVEIVARNTFCPCFVRLAWNRAEIIWYRYEVLSGFHVFPGGGARDTAGTMCVMVGAPCSTKRLQVSRSWGG